MSAAVLFLSNKASVAEIAEHLSRCDASFVPPLSDRVVISDYAQKLANNATLFEAWTGDTLVGLVAAYCNDQEKRIAYITSVSVLNEWVGKGIAAYLMNQCIKYAKTSGMLQIRLEVASTNAPAIKLYMKSGFVADKSDMSSISMNLYFESRDENEQQA